MSMELSSRVLYIFPEDIKEVFDTVQRAVIFRMTELADGKHPTPVPLSHIIILLAGGFEATIFTYWSSKVDSPLLQGHLNVMTSSRRLLRYYWVSHETACSVLLY